MNIQIDKFNIIYKLNLDDKNYESIIKNYLENYFESNIYIYHSDYIYQIVWNNKVSTNIISELFIDTLTNTLINKRQNIRFLIKKNNFNLNSLYNLLNNFNSKLIKIKNILCLNNVNISCYIRSILSEPILFNYLKNEYEKLDNITLESIKKILDILKNYNDVYEWFLKSIGTILKNNIILLKANIPDKYKYFYELNYIIEYTNKIESEYLFLNKSINILLEPIYELLIFKINICIDNCEIIELLNLINYKILTIKKILKNDQNKLIIKSISNNFTNHISNIDNYNNNQIMYLLELIIKCKNLDILENYILLIFENKKIIDSILEIIHEKINTDTNKIKNIISILKIKNKDEFIVKYHKLLIQRILSNELNINNECIIISELLIIFGSKLTNKICRVINDYKISNEELYIYNGENNNKLDIITTSYSNWDINYNEGYIEFNKNNYETDSVKSYINNYQNYYHHIYNNKRKLIWLLQYGEIEITFNNINIILLPIQLLVLELYNIKNEYTFDEILNQSFFNNYSNKFKEDIINSLINGNILLKNNDNLCLNDNNIKNNLVDVYLNNTNIVIHDNITNELAHTREDIVKTLINHYLKLNPIDKDILFNKIKNNISIFELTFDIFNNSIDKMIKYDYITVDNNILTKCIY